VKPPAIESCRPISRILSDPKAMPSFLWDADRSASLAAYPPALPACGRHWTGSPRGRFIWHCSMQGLPDPSIACRIRRLLPYVFILTARSFRSLDGGHFLWHCLFPPSRDPAINRCIALSCPDFPLPRMAGTMAGRQQGQN